MNNYNHKCLCVCGEGEGQEQIGVDNRWGGGRIKY